LIDVLTFPTPVALIQSKANRDNMQAMMARITKKKTMPSPASYISINTLVFNGFGLHITDYREQRRGNSQSGMSR
jgi:hypothetical protein